MSTRIRQAGFSIGLILAAYVWHKRRVDLRKFFRQVYVFGMSAHHPRPALSRVAQSRASASGLLRCRSRCLHTPRYLRLASVASSAGSLLPGRVYWSAHLHTLTPHITYSRTGCGHTARRIRHRIHQSLRYKNSASAWTRYRRRNKHTKREK